MKPQARSQLSFAGTAIAPNLRALALVLAGTAALGGCARVQDLGREPQMTTVGTGLAVQRAPLPGNFKTWNGHAYHSLWGQTGQTLFQDPRASHVGDIVTVIISIDDQAKFDNKSERRRNSSADLGLSLGISTPSHSADLSGDGAVTSNSRTKGEGKIDRSEKLRLSVAGVVTEVLQNGNLMISGSQEVRVNFELRVLNIAGIVRPRDISRNNTIAYEKIAEARISYGGRGRMSEVQQPALGHQIYDLLTPF
ncbi:flagellar basal body L-ring protein FlgH [Pseudochelatococcus contaminans]|uniref:Flagellar L-ring protein n=1 Tax=Pseudochelatococcus contaminans TaxID=1538103 RepID=A0A7W5Z196_9HYPH|nr:flagellar basal body L-ring protein FlgH [Pseudochelatococcus contaminans]MBB3808029.1 flagellar L-ring protein precursor FlgH [Pseudochelatococcus contaminans]